MALITKEEVEALREELPGYDERRANYAIKTVLTKIAAEKLMSEPELLRLYNSGERDISYLFDIYRQDKHGAIMLQDPELWNLMQDYKLCEQKLRQHCIDMQVPADTKSEDL